MGSSYKEEIDELLKKIEIQLKRYSQYPAFDDIKEIIKDRVDNSKKEIICKKNVLEIIKEEECLSKLYKKNDTNYYSTAWIDVLTVQFLHLLGVSDDKKHLLRANYNLESNNQVFRILNLIYNKDLNDSYMIDENNYILKFNIAFFLIEYIFETINKDLVNIVYGSDDYRVLLDNLIIKYNNDVQSIGDVLMAEKPKEQSFRSRYNEIKDYLKMKGYVQTRDSRFKYMRNASSHGEYYPDFENPSNIKIIVEGHGLEKEIISYLDLIEFTQNKLSLLNDKSDIGLFLKLFRSNNITNTVLSLIENDDIRNELISKLCILSLFNIIQYNNENYFRIDKKDSGKESYADKIDLGDFFTTSYLIEGRTNFEIMQTIKNALGHMNVKYNNGIFTFDDKIVNEQCSCSLGSLLLFITEEELYSLTISTVYYERYLKIRDQIRNELNTNKTFSLGKYIPESMQKGLGDFSNKIDLSQYKFYDNIINKKRG
ncbi:MAG: hypothetical protein IJO57_05015 [Bacilli bacterium]|nr:hypothetical protein [Bacilli bacterium]